VPFTSSRSVVRTLSDVKRARWERIAREAAETARRGRVPSIEPVRAWADLFAALPAPVFVAWESERRARLRDVLPATARALSLVIGPEGGIADDEIKLARGSGAISVSLGARNLRSETAAIAAVVLVMDRLQT
jgi:16S rRNA (uracil1498-N3)-methyltransferase